MTLITRVSIKVKWHLFPACQIKYLERWHRSVLYPVRLVTQQADTGTSHRHTHLNLKDIFKHIKSCVKN